MDSCQNGPTVAFLHCVAAAMLEMVAKTVPPCGICGSQLGDTAFLAAEHLNRLEPVTQVVEWDAAAAF